MGWKFVKKKFEKFDPFVQMTDKTRQYIVTSSNYGYLNSIIIIIMVTAAINANDQKGIH